MIPSFLSFAVKFFNVKPTYRNVTSHIRSSQVISFSHRIWSNLLKFGSQFCARETLGGGFLSATTDFVLG